MITVNYSVKTFFLIFLFQMITSPGSLAQSKKIPIDSTYTPVNAWNNIKKDYPATQIAVSVLPEGIISENNLIYANSKILLTAGVIYISIFFIPMERENILF